MKKYLAAFVMLFTFHAHANLGNSQPTAQTNTSQQTGGNYIYAENGKLTFNLEPSLFENRTWQFNNQVDGAVTGFETKLPIKTKNSSSFHAYELAMGYHVYEYAADTGEMKFVRSTTDKPPKGELMYPVYTPRIDKGRTYHVWLPAAVWVVRIVGMVARQVVPPIITRAVTACMASHACQAMVGGPAIVAGWLCALNYSDPNVKNHDGSLCKKARKEGWQPNTNPTNGEQDSMSRTYPYTVTVTYGSYDLVAIIELGAHRP